MDEIDGTDYTDDIPLVTKGKEFQDYKPLDSEYWEDGITKTVTSRRIKIRMTRQAEGSYMFKIGQFTIPPADQLPKMITIASLFASQASNVLAGLEYLKEKYIDVAPETAESSSRKRAASTTPSKSNKKIPLVDLEGDKMDNIVLPDEDTLPCAPPPSPGMSDEKVDLDSFNHTQV